MQRLELSASYLLFILLIELTYAQQLFYSEPFANTYSIVARDSVSGEMGVAVQSHWFSVGTVVSWAEAGVGVVATQSFVNVSFGVRGLELLKEGKSPQQALDILLSDDENADVRQVAIIDTKGRVAAHTGKNCIEAAGHQTGNNFSAQANLMLKNTVWNAMANAFENSSGPLAERLITALEAAENEGGDIRGKQSAVLLIVKGESTGKVWEDKLVDIRVDDHAEPLKELRRIYKVHVAYELMNDGDDAVTEGNMKLALKKYAEAEKLFPDNLEMKFWHAVTLVENDKLEDALPLFKEVFAKNKNWKILTPRLIKSGLLNVSELDLKRILSLTND
jgi:uncharacterized Ntn-hydrolase superfamily protein